MLNSFKLQISYSREHCKVNKKCLMRASKKKKKKEGKNQILVANMHYKNMSSVQEQK